MPSDYRSPYSYERHERREEQKRITMTVCFIAAAIGIFLGYKLISTPINYTAPGSERACNPV